MPDQVTVIGGSGALGQGLALRLAAADVPVVIGSRDEGRAQEAAERVKAQVADADVRGLANGPAAEASEIVAGYQRPARPAEPWQPREGVAAWATEAPRGLLFHRYELDAEGHIRSAQIVPPTSQNQAAIEHDLELFAPSVLDRSHEEATLRFEQLIRSYDPCISCATHFLDLTVDRDR